MALKYLNIWSSNEKELNHKITINSDHLIVIFIRVSLIIPDQIFERDRKQQRE
jgi:hypothetical protein